jgi:osmotically-inducible protein OsmY
VSGSGEEPIPDAYVEQRVSEALAADDRVGELGLAVAVEGDELTVRGTVSTPSRKAGVVAVAREVVDGLGADFGVRDETDVPPAAAPADEEVLG